MSITRPEHEALGRSTRQGGAALVTVGAGGLLLVVSVGGSPLAPFIYALF